MDLFKSYHLFFFESDKLATLPPHPLFILSVVQLSNMQQITLFDAGAFIGEPLHITSLILLILSLEVFQYLIW